MEVIKMKGKFLIGFVVVVIALLGISFVSAMPFGQELSEEEIAEVEAHREAVDEAIESNDYATWKALMEEQIEKMKEGLTEERFDNLIERHAKMAEVRELREELREALENGDDDRVEELEAELAELRPEGCEDCPLKQGKQRGLLGRAAKGFRNRLGF
jgi:DNA-binding GntR family transcriptional regulator